MNTLSKITVAVALSIGAVGISFGQAAPPPPAYAPMMQPAPGYPQVTFPYRAPSPSVEKNAQYYLPYLPWIAQNMALLVNYADFFYQLEEDSVNGGTGAFDTTGTTTANNAVSQSSAQNMQDAGQETANLVNQQLNFNVTTARPAQLAAIPGTDTAIPCTGQNCPTPPDNMQFNADSIFGTLAYPSDQNDSINDLISFLANVTQPLPNPGLSSDPTKRASELQRADVQSYLLTIRSLVSLQSMAISNFNYLAKERETIQDLGKNAGIPNTNDASQLQLEQYLIDKRLNNPDWYAQMNTAPSIAVQRETLYVLAELQRQMFELRMVNERMLATLSTMQMAMTQMGRAGLQYQAGQVATSIQKSEAAPKS